MGAADQRLDRNEFLWWQGEVADFELDLTGFDSNEIDHMLADDLERAVGHAHLRLGDLEAELLQALGDVEVGHRAEQAPVDTGLLHDLQRQAVDLRAALLDAAGGRGFDVVVDNTGLPEMIRLAYDITGPRGRVVLVGVPKKGNETSLYTLPLHFGKAIIGSHGGETRPEEDIPRYLRLYQAGKLRLDALITHECGLDDVNDAIARLRTGSVAGRCLIRL